MWYICDMLVLHKNTGSIIKVPWTQGMFSSRHETSWHTVFLGRFCYCWLLIIHPQCLVRPENSPAHSHMWIMLLFGVTALWGGRPSMAAGIYLKGLTKKTTSSPAVTQVQLHHCNVNVGQRTGSAITQCVRELLSDNGSQNVTKLFQEQYVIVHGCLGGFCRG